MIIHVKQKHIEESKRIASSKPLKLYCPVALALNEATGISWVVDNYSARNKIRIFEHTNTVRDHIRIYDNTDVMPEFTFTLEMSIVHIYVFEDGTICQSDKPPGPSDLVAIEAGVLTHIPVDKLLCDLRKASFDGEMHYPDGE